MKYKGHTVPEGATHYGPESISSAFAFYKKEGLHWFIATRDTWVRRKEILSRNDIEELPKPCFKCDGTGLDKIPRPTAISFQDAYDGCIACDGKGHLEGNLLNWPSAIKWMPEAGQECAVLNHQLDNATWEECVILFVGEFKVIYNSESCKERVANKNELLSFRPIKSDRERLTEEISTLWCESADNKFKDFIGTLYDQGYVVTPKDK